MTFRRCEFFNNWATQLGGGGLYVRGTSNVSECNFVNNHAEGPGGGLLAEGHVSLETCRFTGNTADEGGGLSAYGDGLVVVDTSFDDNEASLGGAVWTATSDSATFKRCLFDRNNAVVGGGVAAEGDADFLLDRCEFTRNIATVGGGLSTADHVGTAGVKSGLFGENLAYAYGGGIAAGSGPLRVENCTIAYNRAESLGGGIVAGNDTSILNSIVWGNVADSRGKGWSDEVAQIEGIEFADIQYSNVQGWSGVHGGDSNMNIDPVFLDPVDPDGPYGPLEANFHLQPDSPCINAGLTETIDPVPWNPPPTALDLDGKPRVLCGQVDMGAYELGLMGDVDCDFVVDLDDFAIWTQCAFGPGEPGLCSPFDADGDGDNDLRDVAALFRVFLAP